MQRTQYVHLHGSRAVLVKKVMARTSGRLFATGALFSMALSTSNASADVLPPPSRPGWDSPPAPLPSPPEIAVLLALALVAALVTLAVRRADAREQAA